MRTINDNNNKAMKWFAISRDLRTIVGPQKNGNVIPQMPAEIYARLSPHGMKGMIRRIAPDFGQITWKLPLPDYGIFNSKWTICVARQGSELRGICSSCRRSGCER
jgi:hypothetical protein